MRLQPSSEPVGFSWLDIALRLPPAFAGQWANTAQDPLLRRFFAGRTVEKLGSHLIASRLALPHKAGTILYGLAKRYFLHAGVILGSPRGLTTSPKHHSHQ
ncbi:MAG: hypothetical protein KatS3mg109_2235 [Pirellulaceae bacterium]|nr:MAG: hypothetical protein KatS3mg109_2235 [Pirellulaceae bacterium]